MQGSASSTEWETDSDSSEADESRPTTPIARVATLRSLSGAVAANNRHRPAPVLPQIQRRPRPSRPPSSLSSKLAASVHPLLGLHPHIASTSSSATTLISAPITITSQLPPLTATLTHQHQKQDPHDDRLPSPIPIPTYPSLSRPRTTSTLSSPSSSAISSLAHIPTRPPSPYAPCHPNHLRHHASFAAFSTPPSTSNLISFFPPPNPLASLESVHPLLPAPFLGNHLTVLANRTPMRESLDRVRAAKAKADAGVK